MLRVLHKHFRVEKHSREQDDNLLQHSVLLQTNPANCSLQQVLSFLSRFLYINDRLSDEDLDFYILSLTQLDEQANPQNLLTC